MSELATRHNEGKYDPTYLLDMLDALIEMDRDYKQLEPMRQFYKGGDFDNLTALLYDVDVVELSRVFMFGAQKYERGNWLKGRPYVDTLASALRHWIAYRIHGIERDEESGCLHEAHFHWNVLAIMQWHHMGLDSELDDRETK